MITASVIADSISPGGVRLTTFEVQFPRWILAEFNTHRLFSRNSASSRAIPSIKIIDRVFNNPAIPVEFGSNQAGMQAGPPLTGRKLRRAKREWIKASRKAISSAKKLQKLGVHKQVTNRILEPFMWHTVIVTSTEWENFFNQRCSPLAQPEIRVAAEAMRAAYEKSVPQFVPYGGLHLPYITFKDFVEVGGNLRKLAKVSAARCARVSYLTHDGKRDMDKDIDLFQKLATAEPPHWSPLEHVATPLMEKDYLSSAGNFTGWAQLRHNLEFLAV